MDLVAVDHVSPDFVEEVAALLRDGGFHPRYDDRRRLIVHNNIPTSHTRVTIYVPEDEAEQAKAVLAAYYDEHVKGYRYRMSQLPPWWDGLLGPFMIALVIGAMVGIASRNAGFGVGGWLLGFILVLKAKSSLLHRQQSKE
ncbi:MAG: hypothetical protein AAF711_14415 [Planctomycetota bacterium]